MQMGLLPLTLFLSGSALGPNSWIISWKHSLQALHHSGVMLSLEPIVIYLLAVRLGRTLAA